MTKKHFEVVAAAIIRTNKNINNSEALIFCAKRPGPKPGKEPNETNFKWEFPGGKIEAGETREQALEREIREEFGTDIQVKNFITTVEHEYQTFSITMHAFYCSLKNSDDNLVLREHLESKWLTKKELPLLDWAAADIPIMKIITQTGDNK